MADRGFLEWPFFAPEHRELAEELRAWCAREREALRRHTGDADADCRALVQLLGGAGWLRYTVPDAFGGAREKLDVRSLALLRETLAYESGLADFAFAMQGLGSGAISLFGTDAQRRAWLPGVAAGRKIAAFALSEQEAGSDVAALATSARLESGDWVLDGSKTWISNGGIADFYVVFARTGPDPGAKGLAAFIVDAGTQGLHVVERIEVIAPHPLATLELRDCRVRSDRLLGRPGQGFAIAMATLDVFRTTVGAAALGFARRALDAALERAQERLLFGKPLAELQMTQAALAEMALAVDAAALLVYRAAWAKDRGQERVTREAAMAKLFATEEAQRVIDRAVQLFGGEGVRAGSVAETLYREIRALRIYEGASEVQKIVIARQELARAGGTGAAGGSR
jgi:acyl-CoA dehydrogenase